MLLVSALFSLPSLYLAMLGVVSLTCLTWSTLHILIAPLIQAPCLDTIPPLCTSVICRSSMLQASLDPLSVPFENGPRGVASMHAWVHSHVRVVTSSVSSPAMYPSPLHRLWRIPYVATGLSGSLQSLSRNRDNPLDVLSSVSTQVQV